MPQFKERLATSQQRRVYYKISLVLGVFCQVAKHIILVPNEFLWLVVSLTTITIPKSGLPTPCSNNQPNSHNFDLLNISIL